jgi:hypothetical protein
MKKTSRLLIFISRFALKVKVSAIEALMFPISEAQHIASEFGNVSNIGNDQD